MLLGKADTLSGERRAACFSSVLALAGAEEDRYLRLEMQIAVAGKLDPPERLELVQLVLGQVISRTEAPLRQAAMLCKLSALIPEDGKESILPTAIEAIARIQAEAWRAARIAELAPSLDARHGADALRLADQIEDEGIRGKALSALIPHLSNPSQQDAIHHLLEIEDPFERIYAAAPIASHLAHDVCDELAESIRTQRVGYELTRELLTKLAPHLSERRLAHLVESTDADDYLD
jgi:hypothetical protein